jgi:uncharacterized membrane protein
MNRARALTPEEQQRNLIQNLLNSASTHPEAIEVSISGDVATLKGVGLAKENSQIERAIRSVPGIRAIQNQLSLLENSENQKEDLPPTRLYRGMRAALGLSGASMLYYGLRRKDIGGLLIAGIGFGAMVRAATHLDTAQLFHLLLHPQLSLRREIKVHAPVEVVYDFWSHVENYSKFMSYVKAVKANERYGFSWTIIGPAGLAIRWDSKIKEMIPSQILSWESCENSPIANSGIIEFKSQNKGRTTQLNILLSYAPPGGLIGWQVIRVLGFDPRARIDTDLLLMKTLIESAQR